MLNSIFNSLFGCTHQRTTFPITPARKISGLSAPGAIRTGTYVACLACGKEFAYDWQSMRIGEPVSVPMAAPTAAPTTAPEAQPVRA
jgi:hypothetical protein